MIHNHYLQLIITQNKPRRTQIFKVFLILIYTDCSVKSETCFNLNRLDDEFFKRNEMKGINNTSNVKKVIQIV